LLSKAAACALLSRTPSKFCNLFNHPNFDLPVNNVASSQFGQLVHSAFSPTSIFFADLGADASPRLIQLKAQIAF
jgi:hypothetical protein